MKFGRRKPTKPPARKSFQMPMWLPWVVLVGVAVIAIYVGNYLPGNTPTVGTTTSEQKPRLSMCGAGQRNNCVVDGDTIWLDGKNLRLASYDTPEPYDDICGGEREVALAKRASTRLLELLNANQWSVEYGGPDGTGERTLATIRLAGQDVGDILIDEGLARHWPDGAEFWC